MENKTFSIITLVFSVTRSFRNP